MDFRNRRGNVLLVVIVCSMCLAAGTRADESEWPRELRGEHYKILIYQPQLESFSGNILEGRFAVSVTPKGKNAPVFGAAWFEARMATDADTRVVSLESIAITAAKFPDQDSTKVQQLTSYLETEIPKWNITISQDDLVASLETSGSHADEKGLKNDAPEIIFATQPSVLVLIDGDPKLKDLEGSSLTYVVNSPFFIAQDPKTKAYYLKGGIHWYTATDIAGTWKPTSDLPSSVADVAKKMAEDEKKQAAENPDQATLAKEEAAADKTPPQVILRTNPAELLQTNGEASFAPLQGTNLLYVTNTENDILMDVSTQMYYILASGRWYSSKALTGGTWTFVRNDKLPADFAKIPTDSDMSQVRPSVAGTQESKEALLENDIPQTAEVDRKTATVTVKYDGDPKFEKCSDAVAYAINTDKSVLLVDNTYYCCDQAIWFVSKGPAGPWEVATSVPQQIQDIPADCPAYNVKYVYIYDSTPDVVYVGYTPAYYGSYVYAGCVVYGTGWYYHPWYGAYYYPRPVTYGYAVHYSPYGGWGFSYGVSYGWLHVSVHTGYGAYWGPAGYHSGYRHGYAAGYNHGYYHGAQAGYRAGYHAGQHSASNNAYKNRGQGVRTTGAKPSTQPAGKGRPTTKPATGATTRPAPKTTNKANNVYADRDGNVYKQDGNDWQKRSGDSWSSSKGSSNVQKDAQSRQRSQQKSTQRSSTQSRGGGGGRRK